MRLKEDIRTGLPKLEAGKYKTIYADPPWAEVGGGQICRGAQNHYGVMKQKDLLALAPEVRRVTAENAHLYLWVTNNFLQDGLDLAKEWGFTYKTMITWGKEKFGIGQYYRGMSEQCLFAVKGNLPYKTAKVPLTDKEIKSMVKAGKPIPEDGMVERRQQGTTLLLAPRMEHSAKPLEMRQRIEKVSYEPRLELFGRLNVPASWDAIGLELDEPYLESTPELPPDAFPYEEDF